MSHAHSEYSFKLTSRKRRRDITLPMFFWINKFPINVEKFEDFNNPRARAARCSTYPATVDVLDHVVNNIGVQVVNGHLKTIQLTIDDTIVNGQWSRSWSLVEVQWLMVNGIKR